MLVPVTRPCDHCQCRDGSVTCVTRQCPPIDDCQQPITLEGACCPICLSCGSKYNGESWKENDCTSCRCAVRKMFRSVYADLLCAVVSGARSVHTFYSSVNVY